jgi:hypothetical protein
MKKSKETETKPVATYDKRSPPVPLMREQLEHIRDHALNEQSNVIKHIAALEELRNDIDATIAILRASQGRGT